MTGSNLHTKQLSGSLFELGHITTVTRSTILKCFHIKKVLSNKLWNFIMTPFLSCNSRSWNSLRACHVKGTTPHSTPSQSDQSKPCKKGLSLTHFADEKTEAQNKMGKLPKITWVAAPGIRTEAQSLSFQDGQCSWEGKKKKCRGKGWRDGSLHR